MWRYGAKLEKTKARVRGHMLHTAVRSGIVYKKNLLQLEHILGTFHLNFITAPGRLLSICCKYVLEQRTFTSSHRHFHRGPCNLYSNASPIQIEMTHTHLHIDFIMSSEKYLTHSLKM